MPQPTDLADLYAWYDADAGRFDAAAGGSPVTADGGPIARWEDRSGNGRHVTQGTPAERPLYDAAKGLVVTAMPSEQRFDFPAAFQLDRQNYSAFFVCELTTLRRGITVGGSHQEFHHFVKTADDSFTLFYRGNGAQADWAGLAQFDGAFHATATRPLTTTRCLIGWVGTASETRCWLDGASAGGTAIGAGTATLLELFGQSPAGSTLAAQAAFKDAIFYDRALSDAEVVGTVLAYAHGRGVPPSRRHQVVFDGDSLTVGTTATLNRNWPSRVAGVAGTVRRRVTAEASVLLTTLAAQAAARVDPLLVPGEANVLAAWATSNDVAFGGVGGAQALANYWAYCDARRAAGWAVVAFTMLPRTDVSGGPEASRQAFNAGVRADWAGHADALADVAADARLGDFTDAAHYDPDGIHLTDAGYQVVADLAGPEIARLLGGGSVLSDPQRADCVAEFFRDGFGPTGEFGAVLKADVRAAAGGIDSYLGANAAAIDSAIPEPARANLTAGQKALLLKAVAAHRHRNLTGA